MPNKTLINLYPTQLWQYFEAICKIPHASNKEAEISQFLQKIGRNLELETIADKFGNVIIRKSASKGLEQCKKVILQAHMDMVCAKNKDSKHNFDHDPIRPYVDGNWLKAKETNLGADNGIALAAILAILEDKKLKHGPLEALFTVSEEIGLVGVANLSTDTLQGDILLNLDSDNFGDFCISCGGTTRTQIDVKYITAPMPKGSIALLVKVSGLLGGHSATEINAKHGNAIKILNQLLLDASEHYPVCLCAINGGEASNSIPSNVEALLALPAKYLDDFVVYCKEFAIKINQSGMLTKPTLKIDCDAAKAPKFVLDQKIQAKLLRAICAFPCGVLGMSSVLPKLVETSSNIGKITTNKKYIVIESLQRSSIEILKQETVKMIECIFSEDLNDICYIFHPGIPYSGWQANKKSKILQLMQKVYTAKFAKKAKITATHGGLECSILKQKYPHLDMISFGPTIEGAHTSDEKVYIPSVGAFWDFLLEVLKNIPCKF